MGHALSVGGHFSFSNSNDIPNGGLNSNYGALTGFIFGPNTYDPTPDPTTGAYPNQGVLANPLEVINRYDFTQEVSRYIGYARLDLAPLSRLSIDYTLGLDTYDQTALAFIPAGTSAPGLANGFARRATFDFLQLNNDLHVRYQQDVAPHVQSTLLVGGTLQYEKGATFSAEGKDLSPVAQTVSSGATVVASEFRSEKALYGGFVQQTVAFFDQLFRHRRGPRRCLFGLWQRSALAILSKGRRGLSHFKSGLLAKERPRRHVCGLQAARFHRHVRRVKPPLARLLALPITMPPRTTAAPA